MQRCAIISGDNSSVSGLIINCGDLEGDLEGAFLAGDLGRGGGVADEDVMDLTLRGVGTFTEVDRELDLDEGDRDRLPIILPRDLDLLGGDRDRLPIILPRDLDLRRRDLA